MACRNAVRWVYRLPRNYSWQSPVTSDRDWAFQDKNGKTRLLISAEGLITVTRGYSWDGCTPKFCVFDLLFGTPDGVVYSRTGHPKTYHASLVHDALYQFLPDGLPFTRAQADACFLKIMAESEFTPRHLYYLAVRAFGGLTRPVTRRIRATYGGLRVDVTAAAREYAGGPTRGIWTPPVE